MVQEDDVRIEMKYFLENNNGICDGSGDEGIELERVQNAIVARLKDRGFSSDSDARRINNLFGYLQNQPPFRITTKNKKMAVCLVASKHIDTNRANATGPELGKAATQSELVKSIAESTGLPQSNVLTILQEFRKELVSALSEDGPGRFTISGVCTIEVQRPSNSEPIVTLRPHKELKEIGIVGDITSNN